MAPVGIRAGLLRDATGLKEEAKKDDHRTATRRCLSPTEKPYARTYGTLNLDRDWSRVAPLLAPTDFPITSHKHNIAQSRFLGQ
jgi:hypothetical protein